MDLVKTIEDTDEVKYESDSSANEEDDGPEPPKNAAMREAARKRSANSCPEFNQEFTFFSDEKEYTKDTWSDVSAYVKKKAKTTLTDKIAKIRKERLQNNDVKEEEDDGSSDGESEDDGCEMDDDEEQKNQDLWDNIKVKKVDEKRKKKKNKLKGDPSEEKDVVRLEAPENEGSDGLFQYDESATFQSMNLSRPLLKAIDTLRWGYPTPIQAATIPTALAGRDICGCAATGTGKTAAFMLPILERLLYRSLSDAVTRVLVVVPTRELGVQVFQVCKQLAQFTTIDVSLSVGGLDLRIQEAELRRCPDVVIATPGRLVDHIKNTPSFTLDTVEVLVLDEADRLLDECFLEQMKEIVKSCSPTRQTMLFSATMTDQVNELALVSLKTPVKIFVDSNKAVAWNLQQEFIRVRPAHEDKQEAILVSLLTRTFTDHVIVFIRTKQQCQRLHIMLGLLGLRAAQLHGNMSQAQRLESLKQFKDEEIDILLTTDVAARGLDIVGVKTVVNFQLPNTVEQYIHRVGRTARAGRFGRSVTFATEDQRKIIREIVKSSRNPVKSRVIPSKVIAKYASKIQALEGDITRVLEEVASEREIAMLENRANRMQKEIDNGPSTRTWIDKTGKNKKGGGESKNSKKWKRKNKYHGLEGEDKEAAKAGDYAVRAAKRARKPKRIRSVVDKQPFKPRKGGLSGGCGGGKKKFKK